LFFYSQRPVESDEAMKLAKRNGFVDYVECSALTQKNLKEVFDVAIEEAIRHSEKRNDKKKRRSGKKKKNKVNKVKRKSVVWWRKILCFPAA